ncbi:MAG: aminotransferase class V-fold PLP-dependent enzyme [Candidatus Nanopelagicales bacterium]
MQEFPPSPDGYLDAVGGQPVLDSARTAGAIAESQAWADPTRLHHAGRMAGILLDAARTSVAASLSSISDEPISAEEVHFAPSTAVAARAAVHGHRGGLVAGRVETAMLLDLADERPGSVLVDVDEFGRVDAGAFAGALMATGGLLGCLQAANAEVGTTQPVTAIADSAMQGGSAGLLVDAGQLIGRAPLPRGWTTLIASARDWAGPAGVAILVVRRRARWQAPDHGGRGWIGGFPDITAAVAAASALEFVLPRASAEADRARRLIDRIRTAALRVPDVEVLGDPVGRLPHILTFSVLYASGEAIVTELDRRGFAVASGSACVAESQRPSHVLAAMGAYTGGNVRVSLPFGCTEATVDAFISALPLVVAHVRGDS